MYLYFHNVRVTHRAHRCYYTTVAWSAVTKTRSLMLTAVIIRAASLEPAGSNAPHSVLSSIETRSSVARKLPLAPHEQLTIVSPLRNQ